jgi:hypothetical protein
MVGYDNPILLILTEGKRLEKEGIPHMGHKSPAKPAVTSKPGQAKPSQPPKK